MMKNSLHNLKNKWTEASAFVGPSMRNTTYIVVGGWILSYIIGFISFSIIEESWDFLFVEGFWPEMGLYSFWLITVTGFLLAIVRLGLTFLVTLWFWLSTIITLAPTAQAAPQLSFAYANTSIYEQQWESTTPANLFEFSQTSTTEAYTPTIPIKAGEVCYEITIDGKHYLITNLTKAANERNTKIVAERMQTISDITRYTVAHTPLTPEGMALLLHNIAHIYEGDFKQNTKSDRTIKTVSIRQLELMTYASHIKERTGISRLRAVEFIDSSFYCQLKSYNSYKKIGGYSGEHEYFRKNETVSDWIDQQNA